MKKITLLFFVVLVYINFLFSQTDTFFGKNAWLYDSVLSSKEFEGRKSGTKGASKAIEWILSKFKEWNLKPCGDNNTYIQKFPMLITEEIGVPKLIIKNAQRGELVLHEGDDFALFTNSGSGKIESDVIFVGYGISETDMNWDDYKDIDVKGKIVLVIEGAPKWITENTSGPEGRNYKFKTASKKGATGFIMYRASDNVIKGASIEEKNYDQNLPGTYIQEWVLREFFKGSGKTFDEVRDSLNNGKYQSFNLNKRVLFEAEVKKIENGVGENVVGIIPGVDPKLKDEYVIFGAHMDHLGKSSVGYIYYGADDNGSGTSVIMELARSLMKSGIRFKRSLVFIGFGGEEQGLLGSNYYVKYPTVPADKIAAMINLDMVGVGDGGVWIGGVESLRKVWDEFWQTLPSEDKEKIHTGRAGLGGSDYTGFKIAGIPAFTSGSTGTHKYYHVIEDDYKYVQPDVMGSVGKIFFKLGKFLGEYPQSLLMDYRNERTLLSSCSLTDMISLKDKFDLTDYEKESFGKDFLEKGIKFCTFDFNKEFDTIKYEEIFKKINDLFRLQKENKDFITLSLNPVEVKNSINGSKLVLMPVINEVIEDSVLINMLSKIGMKYYKVELEKISNLKVSRFISQVKNNNGIVELSLKGDNNFILNSVLNGKIILSGDIKMWLSIENENIIKLKRGILLKIVKIGIEDFNLKNIIDIITRMGKDKIHLDISELIYKSENLAYELVKDLKKNGFNDEDIRNVFGGNLMRVY